MNSKGSRSMNYYSPDQPGPHAGIFICGNEFFAPGGIRRPLTEAERASTAKGAPEAAARVAALAALPPGVDYSSLYGPAGFDARLYAAANRLPSADELRPHGPMFTVMPEPAPGPIRDIAVWLYSNIMVDPQRDMAILGAWLLVASFAGRRDSLKQNPPVVQARVLALNGTGKDAIRKARGMVLQELAQEEGLAAVAACFETGVPAFGTKRLILDDLRTLSTLRIISEAGVAKGTKAGDQASVRAAQMQNFAQNAYSRMTYPGHAERLPFPYGVNTSIFEESTAETFIDLMSGQLSSGEAARMLSFRIDASAVGEAQLHDDAPVPPHVLDHFRKLMRDAMFGENIHLVHEDKYPACSKNPIPTALRRVFTFTPEAEEYFENSLKERTKYRRSNTENEATLEWAQRVRQEQLTCRLALVHARTVRICNDTPSHIAPTVGLEDLKAAEAVVAESRRTERANGGDYDDPISRLTKTLHEYCVRMLSRPYEQRSSTYDRFHTEQEFRDRTVRSSAIAIGTAAPYAQSKALIPIGRYGSTAGSVLRAAAEQGATQGLWEVIENKGQGWRLVNVR